MKRMLSKLYFCKINAKRFTSLLIFLVSFRSLLMLDWVFSVTLLFKILYRLLQIKVGWLVGHSDHVWFLEVILTDLVNNFYFDFFMLSHVFGFYSLTNSFVLSQNKHANTFRPFLFKCSNIFSFCNKHVKRPFQTKTINSFTNTRANITVNATFFFLCIDVETYSALSALY